MRTLLAFCFVLTAGATPLFGQHQCTCGDNSNHVHTEDRDWLSLTATRAKYWPVGHTIKIRFLDGSETQRAKVMRYAMQWTEYAAINFHFADHDKADVRITFAKGGSSSKVGTDALYVTDQNAPTMKFGWLTDVSSVESDRAVVLHEFGHALGFMHEHMHPETNIPWDKPKVYAYFANEDNASPPWSEEKVNRNIFDTLDSDQTFHSKPDQKSIMHYPILNELTIGDFSVPWNNSLSRLDKAMARKIYGGDEYLFGDWDGDGRDNVAVRRGLRVLMDSDFDGSPNRTFEYGNGDSDEYYVGDWNGDGKDNIAVRRDGKFFMDTNFDGSAEITFSFGNGDTDTYLVADLDGDGRDNIGVLRGNRISMCTNFDGKVGLNRTYGNGITDDYLFGDWDGNGTDDIAVRRGNKIFMDCTGDGSPERTQKYGNGDGMVYVVGDWDGDGKSNIGVRVGHKLALDTNFDGKPDLRQAYGLGDSENKNFSK